MAQVNVAAAKYEANLPEYQSMPRLAAKYSTELSTKKPAAPTPVNFRNFFNSSLDQEILVIFQYAAKLLHRWKFKVSQPLCLLPPSGHRV